MSGRDSNLVRKIKKLERLAKKCQSFDDEDTPAGYADGTLDHIFEVVHEANIRIDELRQEEKLAEEREKWEERNEKIRKPAAPTPIPTVPQKDPWWRRWITFGARSGIRR